MTKHGQAQQIRRILNCVPSQDTQNDWRFHNAADAGLLATPAAVPDEKDLRADWWEIGDQGSTGSCVGWASADSVLRWHFVTTGRLDQRERLSVRFQWMASKETDQFITRPTTFIETEGTSLKAAMDVAASSARSTTKSYRSRAGCCTRTMRPPSMRLPPSSRSSPTST